MFKTLYGTNKDGSYKVWSISVEGNTITISHGKLGGKQTSKDEVVCGKNIGRASETSPEQQALLEAQSRYKKQLDKGYRPTLDELDNLPILPMLAIDYNKVPHKLQLPCLTSFKYDGNRILAIKKDGLVSLKSRMGKDVVIPHLQEQLNILMPDGMILDGEVYKHGYALEEIVSAIRTPSNPLHEQLEFHVFDLVSDKPFNERYQELIDFFWHIDSDYVFLVQHELCNDVGDLVNRHRRAVEQGYEGLMMRNLDGLYEAGKRSNDLLKYKTFMDDEFRIVGVSQDRNGNAVFECYDHVANANFNVCYGDFEERKHQLECPDEYIGKWITVKYQTRYKDSGLCQFPTGVCIRACTEDGTPLE